MTSVLVWLLRLLKGLLAGAVFVLLVAVGWTLLQIAAIANQRQPHEGTTEARREAYHATATAISQEDENASLRKGSRIVLLQQNVETKTPASATPAPTLAAKVAAETPVTYYIDLPKLLVPLNPAAGTWIAGMLVPPRAPAAKRDYPLVNIILLGGDEELTEDNFIRTDTMIVVSLNLETGTVSMLSLPRDLFVYMPHGNMSRLNTAFGIGEYRNWDPGRGFGMLRQTIFYNFGINVHYFARVNFSGFEKIIDLLGGVDIAVDCAYRDYYPVEEFEEGAPASRNYRWRTLPPGYYTFDGFDALWYARTRKYTDDLDRGRRQQQLLRAMWRKANGEGLLSTFPRLWNELSEVVETDIPFDIMLRLLPYFLDLDLNSVENFVFKRKVHLSPWKTPDGSSVLLPVPEGVTRLMQDFYTPPSPNQTALTGASIAVYNGSGQENWDIVASERLRWEGYNAVALGLAIDDDGLASNRLIDHVATEKGSLVPRILRALNMTAKQVKRDAKADRDYDYEVTIGRDYKSCTFGVLPIDG